MTNVAGADFFPPYGHMILEWETSTNDPKTPPADWNSFIGYDVWREAIVELLSAVLWPRYIKAERRWSGPATAFMHDLTLADFGLFPGLRALIETEAGIGGEVTHLALFQIEDERDVLDGKGNIVQDLNVDATLRKYLRGKANPLQVYDVVTGYIDRLATRAGNIDLDLKVDMQRPRAYQVSWMLGIDFTHQQAKSALTPSMISGHCFEMMMGGLGAYTRALELGCPPAALEAIAQHMVDAGDRRVFAGVHYPSDNISSWIVGLLVCPYINIEAGARAWLWASIKTRSAVYRAIATAIEADPSSPLARPMQLLAAIGDGRIVTIDDALGRSFGPQTAAAA
jgi:hypothetical protein